MSPRTLLAPPGFTMIELLITVFIIGTVVTGLFGLFVLDLRSAQESERRVAGIALANQRMEMIRNLPYEQIGTSGGVPSGAIAALETIIANGVSYTVNTDIRYVDDAYDGTAGAYEEDKVTVAHQPPGNPGGCNTLVIGANALNAHLKHGDELGPCPGDSDPNLFDPITTDYKLVRVQVGWPSPNNVRPVLLITHVAPQGVEGGTEDGTLAFQVFNSTGAGIPAATVTISNDEASPAINLTTQTNNDGRVVLPGLPAGTANYELSVTKNGYSQAQTYDQTTTFFPSPDYVHLSMFAREVTEKTFTIDEVGSIALHTQNDAPTPSPIQNFAYTLQGTKTIGQDDTGATVYKVSQAATTNATGDLTHTGVEWDSYDIIIDGAATGYDLKESSILLPLAVNPLDSLDLTLSLSPYTPISLQVTVVNPTGQPVDNATVQLLGNEFDATLKTGILGQVLFSALLVNADYTLNISAPGFVNQQQPVEVLDTTRTRVNLTPAT